MCCVQKLLIGLSFSVGDIEQAISFLKTTDLGSTNTTSSTMGGISASRLEIQHVPGFPRFITFNDPAFLNLEISDGAMGIQSSLTTIQSTGVSGSGASAAMMMRGGGGGMSSTTA